MVAKKQGRIRNRNHLFRGFSRVATELIGRGRLPLVVIALLTLIGGGIYAYWRHVAPTIAARDEYRLTADRILITPTPDWIATDVKEEVLREGSLDQGLSVLDVDLDKRLKDAFEMHAWVRSVDRVAKCMPVGVKIAITFRRPVAAVVVPGHGGKVLSPVDADGVRLPNEGMRPDALRILPRIAGPTGQPVVGQAWREKGVLDGCRLAAYLAPTWIDLHLVDIVPATQEIYQQKQYFMYELVTRGGTRIVWGAAPNTGPPGESSPAAKLSRLRRFIDEHGPLIDVNSPAIVDIRQGPTPKTTPRTAHRNENAEADAAAR